jgi:hypothetical protein
MARRRGIRALAMASDEVTVDFSWCTAGEHVIFTTVELCADEEHHAGEITTLCLSYPK